MRLFPSSCLSVRVYATARESLNVFSLNLVLWRFTKICRHISVFVKIGQQYGRFTWRSTCVSARERIEDSPILGIRVGKPQPLPFTKVKSQILCELPRIVKLCLKFQVIIMFFTIVYFIQCETERVLKFYRSLNHKRLRNSVPED
jgi:hypothetical protein